MASPAAGQDVVETCLHSAGRQRRGLRRRRDDQPGAACHERNPLAGTVGLRDLPAVAVPHNSLRSRRSPAPPSGVRQRVRAATILKGAIRWTTLMASPSV